MFTTLLFLGLVAPCLGAVGTATCGGGTAYVGVPFTVTCSIAGAIVDGGIVWYRPNGEPVVTCDAAGSCSSDIAGYSVTTSTSSQQTLVINSPSAANDVGDFGCEDGIESFTPCTLAVVPAMSSTLMQNDLQSMMSQTFTASSSLTLVVATSCTTPAGVCTWSYQNTELVSETGTFDGSFAVTTSPSLHSGQQCSGGSVHTVCTLTISSTPSFLANRKVTLSLNIAHASLVSPIIVTSSNVLTFAAAMSSTLVQNDLQSMMSQTFTASSSLTLVVATSCTTPVGVCTWSYQNTELVSETGTFDGSFAVTTSPSLHSGQQCSGGSVHTVCTLTISSTPGFLANRKVTLSLSIAHPSLVSPITVTSSSILTFADSSSGHCWHSSVSLMVIGCSIYLLSCWL
ncbi:uncharacterized protein LOC121367952 [Gigantopelta aegis]|uniref:uncharacterized protein LOC121367952 n=1 Tax=Gigantopelta aegis TaxID=1735272 RepID=UPI001B88C94E|nr:uncharacterized protein LOC121367952 [Gigantopelta aegis]